MISRVFHGDLAVSIAGQRRLKKITMEVPSSKKEGKNKDAFWEFSCKPSFGIDLHRSNEIAQSACQSVLSDSCEGVVKVLQFG